MDRILDVMLLPPQPGAKANPKRSKARPDVFEVDEEDLRALKDGVEPPSDAQMEIDDWEEETGRDLGPDDVDRVARLVTWCYVKWDDLQYEQCKFSCIEKSV